jgi:hypothetical protein
MTRQFVIEHRRRGVYIGWAYMGASGEWKPRFLYTIRRSDAVMFSDLAGAEKELAKINGHVRGCYISEFEVKP